MSLVVGFDPGLAALGYGLIDSSGPRLVLRGMGVFRTERREGVGVGRDLTVRIGELAEEVSRLLDEHRPEAAVIEEFRFYGRAVTSSLQLGNVVGMLRETLRARGIPTAEYSAREIKRAVVGNANADKRAVQRMVQLRLALAKPPRPTHAADALAAAIAHAARLPLLRLGGGTR